MAANNIAATFAAARGLTSAPSSAAAPTSHSLPAASAAALSLSVAPPRPLAASWNPHSALPRSRRSSLLSLYGLPGPLPRLSSTPPPRSGRRLPSSPLSFLDPTTHTLRATSLPALSRSTTAVVLGVPGAFAPSSLGGGFGGRLAPETLVRRAGEMRRRGVGAVAVVAANDVYVMRAWGEALGAGPAGVEMLSDPGAGLAGDLGLAFAADGHLAGGAAEGLGVRSECYCLVAMDGAVKALFVPRREDANFDDVIRAL